MALGETIVAAAAGLTGAALGAWSTSRAGAANARRAEVTAARAELATIYELIWAKYAERKTRVSLLRYRLAHLGVAADDLSALMSALAACDKEASRIQQAIREGYFDDDDPGAWIDTALVTAAVSAADHIALNLR